MTDQSTTKNASPGGTVRPIVRRRPRHGFGDTRTRCWIRSNGRILRFITVTDYSVCGPERGPNTFMKRLAHTRWPRGHHMCRGKYDQKYAAWYEQFEPGQWYDIT